MLSLLPAFRRTAEQVAAYARAWERQNEAASARQGPLWVVLGDSAGQGVGASAYDGGYVGPVRASLGPQWRVINLSRSGARTRDVLDVQLPRLAELPPPDLLSAIVGANDATHSPLARWLADVDALFAALPAGAVVGTVSRGWRERKTRIANAHIRTEAARRGLRLADIWAYTGPPYQGKYADGFHPNDAGYREWRESILAAVKEWPGSSAG